MDERDRREDRLPGASEAFTRGIFAGADAILRYERRRARRRIAALAVTAALLAAVGLGAAVSRLGTPRPDSVVAAVDPARTPALTETSPPPETPPPSETPPPEEPRLREDPDSGIVTLLDDGPFEPGEWVCVTDALGRLDYGLILSFREQPGADARAVDVVAGMQVKYLGDADGGFAKVLFAGIEGYVEADCLRRPPGAAAWDPDDGLVVANATLYLTNSRGAVIEELVEASIHSVSCYALRKLLDSASPARAAYPDAPMGALLVVSLSDPDAREYRSTGIERYARVVRFALPCDGTQVLQAEGGDRYTFSAPDWAFFWEIFQVAATETWSP